MEMEIDTWSDTVTTVDSTPATKADLDALEQRTKAELDAFRKKMAEVTRADRDAFLKRMSDVSKADTDAFLKRMSEVSKADTEAFLERMSEVSKADRDASEKRLEGKLSNYPTKQDLANEIASAFNVALEQMRIFIGALDDKHTHRTDQLRSDLDAHRADTVVHRAPRSRKTGSR
jgi:hypothetical protein